MSQAKALADVCLHTPQHNGQPAQLSLQLQPKKTRSFFLIFFNFFTQVKALAHVFLDTPQYNGHGTATDALWAGIPIVTFPGFFFFLFPFPFFFFLTNALWAGVPIVTFTALRAIFNV
jgi:predicted O-linked N-acetylglucosamine transferase (SPINDLY family)